MPKENSCINKSYADEIDLREWGKTKRTDYCIRRSVDPETHNKRYPAVMTIYCEKETLSVRLSDYPFEAGTQLLLAIQHCDNRKITHLEVSSMLQVGLGDK